MGGGSGGGGGGRRTFDNRSPEALRAIIRKAEDKTSVAAFESSIEWTHAERKEGRYIGYGMVPRGEEHARGVFELRRLQPGFLRGELGFVIAPDLWGTGLFGESGRLLLDFAFRVVKVHRIEARAAVDNVRGNGAMRKLGAEREGTLKEAFVRDERYIDQNLWALLDTRWKP